MKTSHSFTVSVALCASLLCVSCSSTKIDFTDKNAEQAAEAIQALNKKITGVTIDVTDQGVIANISWLAKASPLITEKTDIRQLLYSITQATGIEKFDKIRLIIDETENNEMQNKALALTLGWEREKLQAVRWVNVADYQLFEIANIDEVGPFGAKAISDYCGNGGSTRYGKEFCARAGWTE